MSKLTEFCRMLGLHPLVGFGLFAVDWMLFAGEGLSLGAGWLISLGVAVFLAIVSVVIQKAVYGDGWLAAIGKGGLIGLLTAIPTALPSVVPLAGGAMGTWAMVAGQKALPGESSSEL